MRKISGAGAMVLKGVKIGDNSVVGAGSVVASNVRANVVVFGNPARVVWRLRQPMDKKSAEPAAAAPPPADGTPTQVV